MKRILFFKTIASIFVLLLVSCNKDEGLSVTNSFVIEQCTTTSFTASITGSFNAVDKVDLALSKKGVLYCVQSDGSESLFMEWLNGNDNSGCMMSEKTTVNGESIQCAIENLTEDTEYNYCLFLQKRDGTRKISAVSSLKTKSFNPAIMNFLLYGINCFTAYAKAKIVMDDKDAACCEIGVLLSERSNCNIDDSELRYSMTNNEVRISDLESSKNYYARLYIRYLNHLGNTVVLYGAETTFRTKDFEEMAVDLGLPSGILWASCNVGADKPEEYGDYYAWGDIDYYYEDGYARETPLIHLKIGKENAYDYTSYVHCNGNYNGLTKYCNDSSYGNNGYTDNKTVLDLEDDVAHVKWGGNWRMATVNEFKELTDNCTWEWITLNGIDGCKITSNMPGYTDHSIFMPATGRRDGKSLVKSGSSGHSWSSSLDQEAGNTYCALALSYKSSDYNTYSFGRRYGLPVRPVWPR